MVKCGLVKTLIEAQAVIEWGTFLTCSGRFLDS